MLLTLKEREEKPAQYKTLIEKHGNLEKLVNIDLTPKKEAVVKLVCEEKDVSEEITISLEPTILEFMKWGIFRFTHPFPLDSCILFEK